jgi:AAA ATPase domain
MEPGRNPYTPNAGARPPALLGRDEQLLAFEVLLERLGRGNTDRAILITGLRGVGKTVLLGAFRGIARSAGWVTVGAEITRSSDFATRIARLSKRALLELAPADRWKDRVRRAAGVLKSFSLQLSPDGSVTGTLEVEPVNGVADSGDLGDDLAELFVALGGAAQQHDTGVVFLIDEVQFLDPTEFEALIAAMHMVIQEELPITVVGAGLPQLPRLAGEAKSYAERLFRFPRIGALNERDAARALTEPAEAQGVSFEARAVRTVVEYTQGYPYFIQEYGQVLWDTADQTPIGAIAAVEAQALVEATLDADFFSVRVERASDRELVYLRAMAELGSNPQRASDIARALGRTTDQVSTMRARLIDKGLLFAPRRGLTAFTVPQFDRYLRRAYPGP